MSKKILVVDDDPDTVEVIRITLESANYEVLSAVNSEQGLRMVLEERPDLIILDVMMDTPTEGFELAKELHNQDPKSKYAKFREIPILMLTAVQSKTPLLGEMDMDYLPVELYVDKPIDPEDLVSKVDWMLSREKA